MNRFLYVFNSFNALKGLIFTFFFISLHNVKYFTFYLVVSISWRRFAMWMRNKGVFIKITFKQSQ